MARMGMSSSDESNNLYLRRGLPLLVMENNSHTLNSLQFEPSAYSMKLLQTHVATNKESLNVYFIYKWFKTMMQ